MNIEELQEALEDIFSTGFRVESDSHGQLVVYTGLQEDEDGELSTFVEEDEDDEESDPDFEQLEDEDEDE